MRSFIPKTITKIFLTVKKVKYGKKPRFSYGLPILVNDGEMVIGSKFNCIVMKQARVQITIARNAKLTIGDDFFMNQGASITCTKSITIGNNVRIGDFAAILDSNLHEVEQGKGIKSAPVVIEDTVWIARGAVILPGVHIGRGSVISANSVLSESVPPNSLVIGNPAKVVKILNSSNSYIRG